MSDTAILITSPSTSIVSIDNASTAVAETTNSSIITLDREATVLVERLDSTVLITGLVGPQGLPGLVEEDVMYSKRIDTVSDTELYRGEAAVGTAESSALWRIRKISISLSGDIEETWAGGTADFDKVWANRLTLNYT